MLRHDTGAPTDAADPWGRSPTPPFIWAATLLAVTAGFGLGAALFAHRPREWWPAAIQAHGHVQVFGWAGLLVLGVALHFLPRLRGTRLVRPELVPWVLGLYGGGVALRALAQPLVAAGWAPGVLLPLSGLLEIAGAGLAVGLLAATGRRGRPLDPSHALLPVLPFIVLAFASVLLCLLGNLIGLWLAMSAPLAIVPAPWHLLALHLGLVGFLVAVSLAMSVRTFPLYLRVRVVPRGPLQLLFGVLLAGLVMRLAAYAGAPPLAQAVGMVLEGAALLGSSWLLDAPWLRTRAAVLADTAARARARGVEPRPAAPLPGELVAADLLLRQAYGWLIVAGLLLLGGGLAEAVGAAALPQDAERHALGAGFITLLILGMGVRLVPGFLGRRKMASGSLVWATLWLGSAAALLRVGPPIANWLVALAGAPPLPTYGALGGLGGLLALSGVLDVLAVAAFGWNLWRTLR